METIAAYMAANPSVGTFLSNPTMEDKAKKDIITKLGKEADFHPFTANFLNLLVDKKRIQNVEDIVEEFENLYCESTDTQVRSPDRPFFSSTAIQRDRSPAPEAAPRGPWDHLQPIQPPHATPYHRRDECLRDRRPRGVRWQSTLDTGALIAADLHFPPPSSQIATVTSAVKLENEQQFMIAKKIQEMTGAKNIKLKPEVDPALLGGFVVTYGKDGSGL